MITRTYNPVMRGGPVAEDYSALGAPDLSGMNYQYRVNTGDISSMYKDITGNEVTPDQLANYTSIAQQNQGKLDLVGRQIFKDNWSALQPDYAVRFGESGTNQDPSSAWADWKQSKKSSTYDSGTEPTYFSNEGGPAKDWNRPNSVANFITKMNPDALTNLFTDVGIKNPAAVANIVAQSNKNLAGNASEEQRRESLAKLGFDEGKLNILGTAMFSGNAGARKLDDGKIGAQQWGSDNNNADYYKNTNYSKDGGLYFTGGFIPDPQKKDWMGMIIKSVLLGGWGFVAAPLLSNAAASVLGSAGTTIGYAGATVPNALATTIGSAGAGALTGGVGAAMSGGDFKKGALTGGLLGGISGVIGTRNITGNKMVDSAITGAAKGAITSKVSGGDVLSGIISGGVTGAFTPAINNSFVSGIMNGAVRGAINGSKIRRA